MGFFNQHPLNSNAEGGLNQAHRPENFSISSSAQSISWLDNAMVITGVGRCGGVELSSSLRKTECHSAQDFLRDYGTCIGCCVPLAIDANSGLVLNLKGPNERKIASLACTEKQVPTPSKPLEMISAVDHLILHFASHCAQLVYSGR